MERLTKLRFKQEYCNFTIFQQKFNFDFFDYLKWKILFIGETDEAHFNKKYFFESKIHKFNRWV